ncbi:MAG: formylglycine-generating enzyme family protein, partial [Bacteroidetes bacterium]|nr:formylglycine-generating enzyme family protein [Bacteroidota bacterium]
DTREIKVGDVKFRLKYVDAGTFFMGAQSSDTNGINYDKYADKHSTVHQVTLTKSYWIGETEVTHALWEAIMGKDNNPSYYLGSYQNPVNSINYYKANEFIEQLNKKTGLKFRLPTEAEWEYAAKGGHKSNGFFHRYSGSSNLDEVGWYKTNNHSVLIQEVAQKQPNELGIYDMSGNVAEWCLGKFIISDGSSEVDPLEIMIDGIYPLCLRGGCIDSEEQDCTVFKRFPAKAVRKTTTYRDDFFGTKNGLRLVLEDRY